MRGQVGGGGLEEVSEGRHEPESWASSRMHSLMRACILPGDSQDLTHRGNNTDQ